VNILHIFKVVLSMTLASCTHCIKMLILNDLKG